jgi:hypothetical protein
MSKPILDVFRFLKDPTEAFTYLGAIWTIEIKPALIGDHWECATTAPVSMVLAMDEDESALRQQLFETGTAVLRNTQRCYLCEYLESIGMMERVLASHARSYRRSIRDHFWLDSAQSRLERHD